MRRLTPTTMQAAIQEALAGAPPAIVPDLPRSRDAYLAGAIDGRRYLDLSGRGAGQPLGYNHARLIDPAFVTRAGRAAAHAGAGLELATAELAEFGTAFRRVLLPDGMPHLVVVRSDEAAFDTALTAAFTWKAAKVAAGGGSPSRAPQVISLKQSSHGRGGFAPALCATEGGAIPGTGWPRITCPAARHPLEGAVLRDVEDREIQALAELRTTLREHSADVAAVLLEPILVEAGDLHLRAEFLREVRRACDEFGALFVIDETRTGPAASGHPWCFQHADVLPDLLVFGGHLAVPGVVASERVEEGNTGNGSVLAAAARTPWPAGPSLVDLLIGTRILEAIEADDLAKNAAEVGKRLTGDLVRVAEVDPRMTNVRGRGLLVAFDLPSGELRDRVLAGAREHGLLAGPAGLRGVRLRPPLTTTKAIAEHAISLLHDALVSCKKG